jgi:hypothetical protein
VESRYGWIEKLKSYTKGLKLTSSSYTNSYRSPIEDIPLDVIGEDGIETRVKERIPYGLLRFKISNSVTTVIRDY